jgi:SecD/SecF fusion protein
LQSKSNLFLAIVLALTALSIVGFVTRDFQLGIDVKGGIRLIYSVEQTPESKEQNRTLEADRTVAIKTLRSRVERGLAVNEGTVQAKGANQIVVELPDFTDIVEARKMMGSTARLQAFHARNVTTSVRRRTYSIGEEKVVDGIQVVYFVKSSGGDQIGPDDPEYKEIISQWTLILQGADLADAFPNTLANGRVVPEFRFAPEGARKMEAWTRSVMDQGEQLAFVIDGKVLSIAPIKERTILTDSAFIDGEFEPKAVRDLTTLLREGALEVILNPESEQFIDPSIGKGALDQIVIAGGVSYLLICAFLIAYYGVPGIVAAVAMVLYGLFTLTALKYLNATFSLAAIAGFILSLGMAVDANILVFERIKEEIRAGRTLMTAAELGFKRALSAIVDSNACTIITSIVLYILGSGPVKGFATTLIWGVLISFFTAITVTRALLISAMKAGIANDPKHFALKRNWFGEKFEAQADSKPLNIVGRTRTWFAISIILILGGLVAVGAGGIKPNVEFGGGYEGVYAVTDQNSTLASIRAKLGQAGFEKANVKLGSAKDEQTGNDIRVAYITVPPDAKFEYPQGMAETDKTDFAKAKIAQSAGLADDAKASFQKVGPTIQQETVTNAYLGVTISTVLIIVYIALRFGVALGGMKNGIKFGLSAIVALVHDALFVFGMAGIMGLAMGWEISSLFITAMLTVIGFSVHDTIVIFDRIRENLRRPHKGETFDHLVDKSVTQTVARSINTSMMAFITLMILVFFGTTVPEIKFMCLTMAAGIAVGTYSSIFNASPILWLWNKATIKSRGEQADLMAEAQREAKLRAKIAIEGDDRVYKDDSGGTYGQIKRKTSAVDKAKHDIDADDDKG